MAFVPAPGTVLVELRYLYQGQQVENTLYFDMVGGVDQAKMFDLADAIGTRLVQSHLPNLPAALVLREIYVTDLSSAEAPTLTYTGGLPHAGGAGGEAMPNNVTLTVSFRTAARGRSGRGRNYLLGITENQVANNTVSTDFNGVWGSFYAYLLTLASSDGFIWSVCSTVHDKVPRTEALVRPIEAYVFVDQTVDAQRRRLPGRGK